MRLFGHPLRFTLLALPASFLASAGTVFAEELWSWHAVDFTFLKTPGLEWGLHTRLRTREGEVQQSRSGTILRFRPQSRVSLIAGYYFGREEDTREEWQDTHRVFSGAEARVYRKGDVSVATRGLVERFFAGGRPDSTRVRQRIRFSVDRTVGPYASAEWFFDPKGYLAGRYAGGLRWRWSSWGSVEFGYLYDARSSLLGAPRHILITHVFLERRRER